MQVGRLPGTADFLQKFGGGHIKLLRKVSAKLPQGMIAHHFGDFAVGVAHHPADEDRFQIILEGVQ